jgi:hypothetical protein
MTRQRAQSWIPFALQNLVWGSLEPATEDISKIEALPGKLENGIRYLQKLPNFLEDLKDHLERMTSLTRADYESLGYSSVEDFKHLYTNRSRSSSLLFSMYRRTFTLSFSFITREGSKLDKDTSFGTNSRKYVYPTAREAAYRY